MRLLVVNSFSDISETALWCRLAKHGINVSVMCDPAADERPTLAASGVMLHDFTIRHRLDFAAVRNIRRVINVNPCDILHATRNRELSTSLMATLGKRTRIVSYRGTVGHISRLDPASWLTYLNPRVDRIVCLSKAVKAYLLSLKLPEHKLVTIYRGFDTNWFRPASRDSFSFFRIPSNAFVVGFAGKMRPIKGIISLLKAVEMLPDSSTIHFLLVGEIQDKRIHRMAEHPACRKRVHFTGYRKDAAALMGACDLFVMPSLAREGMCRALIEAMSQRVPPVVTNVGGMPEVVVHNECGLVVPPNDPAALLDAITSMAINRGKLRQLGERAAVRIKERFNLDLAFNSYVELYENLLGSN